MQEEVKKINTMHWQFFKKYYAMDLQADETWEMLVEEIDKVVPETDILYRDYIKRLLMADAELLNDIRKAQKHGK